MRALPLVLLVGLALGPGCGKPSLRQAPSATGRKGAAATIDVRATAAALEVLERGGNAVDAAVAASAVIGVTDPFSCSIGGGGAMLVFLADEGRAITVEHREVAPQAFTRDLFYANGAPLPFAERVTSGLSTGVPGLVAGWDEALRHYGTRPLAELLEPAIRVAEQGFEVDQTFFDFTEQNLERFRDFTSTSALFLTREGQPLPVGSTFRNPDLARTYRLIAKQSPAVFYRGEIARAIVDTLAHPPLVAGATRTVRPGVMQLSDLGSYDVRIRQPTQTTYRGSTLIGAAPPVSGGITVGLLLHLLEGFEPGSMSRAQVLHLFLEASRLAYADRNAWVADPGFFDVPTTGLLSEGYAQARRRDMDVTRASTSAAAPGNPLPFDDDPSRRPLPQPPPAASTADEEDALPLASTTHLTVVDAKGNIVAYTCTLEQEGGNGMVVPGYGFLLNNELTDFTLPANPDAPDPNVPEPGKRPRSNMSPTLVFRDGAPVMALGSPGGGSIPTTVAQVLMNVFDFGMSLEDAVAAPRVSQRNSPRGVSEAEPAFLASPEAAALMAQGHTFREVKELGAVTAIRFNPDGTLTAVAEPVRRGGGSAGVVRE